MVRPVDLNQWADKLPTTKAELHPTAGLNPLIGDAVTSDEDIPAREVRNKIRDSTIFRAFYARPTFTTQGSGAYLNLQEQVSKPMNATMRIFTISP